MPYLAGFISHQFGVPVFFNSSIFLMSLRGFGPWETLVIQIQAYSM